MRTRRRLRILHVWLGWIVGVPLLFWTVSGAVMVVLPIETVRGEHLLAEAPPVALAAAPVPPATGPRPVASIALHQRAVGARWVVRFADGEVRMADPADGRLLPPINPQQAAAEVRSRYRGEAAIVAVDRTSAEEPPLDLRRPIAAWRVTMSDGTRFYVEAATGDVAARRTPLWRFFDFMWGLHIMDLGTRENINNLWVRAFSLLGAVSVLIGLLLLPLVNDRRRKRAAAPDAGG